MNNNEDKKISHPIILYLLLLIVICSCSSSHKSESSQTSPRKKQDTSIISTTQNSKTDTIKQSEPPDATTPISHPQAIGLWMVPKEHSLIEKDGIGMIPWQSIFKYDGRYLTVQIIFVVNGISINPPKWPSKDGFYKLKTEWRGDICFIVRLSREQSFWLFMPILLSCVPMFMKKCPTLGNTNESPKRKFRNIYDQC